MSSPTFSANLNPFLTVHAASAETVTVNGADQTLPEVDLAMTAPPGDLSVLKERNSQFSGALFILDITAVTGTTPTLVVKLQAKDPVSGKYVDIPGAAYASQNAAVTLTLLVYPGTIETANGRVSYVLPGTFRAVYTITGTTPSFTFTLSAQLLR